MLDKLLSPSFDAQIAFTAYLEHKQYPTEETSQTLFNELLKMITLTLDSRGLYRSYPQHRDELNQVAAIRVWQLVSSLQQVELANAGHLVNYCRQAIYWAAVAILRIQKKHHLEVPFPEEFQVV